MVYRHERKYYLDAQTAGVFKKRAAGALRPDSHSGGRYWVHNIYFDDMFLSAYKAKQLGAFTRDKYRIRYYNGDLSYIRLEHKHKEGEMCAKRSVLLSQEDYAALTGGELPFHFNGSEPVGAAFSLLYKLRRLRPVVEFSYFREAYVHPAGNVRVTFDSAIPGGYGIMELKYSRFLPCFVSELLTGLPIKQVEMSKYNLAVEAARASGGGNKPPYNKRSVF